MSALDRALDEWESEVDRGGPDFAEQSRAVRAELSELRRRVEMADALVRYIEWRHKMTELPDVTRAIEAWRQGKEWEEYT